MLHSVASSPRANEGKSFHDIQGLADITSVSVVKSSLVVGMDDACDTDGLPAWLPEGPAFEDGVKQETCCEPFLTHPA